MRTRSALLVSVAALAVVVTLTVPAEAGDGVPPCGDACYGRDPHTYVHHGKTCGSDARTVAQKLENGRTMQLRYSNRCETAWGRIYGGQFRDSIWVINDMRGQDDHHELMRGEREGWTRMVNDHNSKSRACVWISHVYPDRSHCTAEY